VRTGFGASRAFGLSVVSSRLTELGDAIALSNASAVVIDLDAARDEEMVALLRLMARIGSRPPVLAVTQSFDENAVRMLSKLGVTDSLAKPVAPTDLERACVRAIESGKRELHREAQIYTFLPVVGGAGVTTLAVETAMLLLKSAGSRNQPSTCLIDLDLQHGVIADYLDLEPRLNVSEIEPRPERLDRQMLEIMISKHASGLAVVAAPHRPAEMRSLHHDVVTRLLDLVSANFEYVVIDMPRSWFSWTDSVLRGSDRLFVVTEMTVPNLRRTKQLVAAIKERLEDGPKPQVLVNCFEQRILSSGLRRRDLEEALGEAFAGTIPKEYALVREAIDRGVALDEVTPSNSVTLALKKLVLPQEGAHQATGKFVSLREKLAAGWTQRHVLPKKIRAEQAPSIIEG